MGQGDGRRGCGHARRGMAEDLEITRMLHAAAGGDREAAAALLPRVYAELRALAAARLRRAPPGQTLQATALVHEAYLALVGGQDPGWSGRGHFFGAAAQAMREIVIDQARRKAAVKRGGGLQREAVEVDGLALGDGGPAHRRGLLHVRGRRLRPEMRSVNDGLDLTACAPDMPGMWAHDGLGRPRRERTDCLRAWSRPLLWRGCRRGRRGCLCRGPGDRGPSSRPHPRQDLPRPIHPFFRLRGGLDLRRLPRLRQYTRGTLPGSPHRHERTMSRSLPLRAGPGRPSLFSRNPLV